MKKLIDTYKKSYAKYGADPKALKWASSKAARQRHEQIVSGIDFEGKTILDVGCGFGDIIPFVEDKTSSFEYTGVDLIKEFIKEAKRKYPEHKFIVRNYFSNPLPENFDIIISSGALNSNIENNLKFRQKAIKLMFEHCNDLLVFNMAGSHPQRKTAKKSNVWFADSKEIIEYCKTLSKRVILKDDYHKRDFTIVMFK